MTIFLQKRRMDKALIMANNTSHWLSLSGAISKD